MNLDHEKFNISMRKFLKKVGVTSQQKIEEAVRKGIENNSINPNQIKVKVKLFLYFEVLSIIYPIAQPNNGGTSNNK